MDEEIGCAMMFIVFMALVGIILFSYVLFDSSAKAKSILINDEQCYTIKEVVYCPVVLEKAKE